MKCTAKSKNINNGSDLNVNRVLVWIGVIFFFQTHDKLDNQRPEGDTVGAPVLKHSKLTELLSESCSYWLMINHVSHSELHKRIYQLLCHLKCPFSWGKNKSVITSIPCYSNKPNVRYQWTLLKHTQHCEGGGVTSRRCHFGWCGDEYCYKASTHPHLKRK